MGEKSDFLENLEWNDFFPARILSAKHSHFAIPLTDTSSINPTFVHPLPASFFYTNTPFYQVNPLPLSCTTTLRLQLARVVLILHL